jgi:L-ascorbate metabolism protein UlaG (beta-lactamase superfamily)
MPVLCATALGVDPTLSEACEEDQPMRITYYGHSCIGVETAGKHLLFDPFISGNPAAKHIDLERVPADVVLLTHGHGDHMLDAEAILKRTGATLVANYEVVTWFGKKGIEGGIGLNLGGGTQLGGLNIRMTIAHHSSELPDGSYGGNPGGFVVQGPEGAFHHAGDTALTLDMQLLKRFKLKIACLPIGDHFTMGVDDAVEAAQLMGVTQVLGLHYNTFPPITIDTEKAKAAFQQAGITLHLPGIGESISL